MKTVTEEDIFQPTNKKPRLFSVELLDHNAVPEINDPSIWYKKLAAEGDSQKMKKGLASSSIHVGKKEEPRRHSLFGEQEKNKILKLQSTFVEKDSSQQPEEQSDLD